MADHAPPPPPAPPNGWAKATLRMVVVGVIALNAALFFYSCRRLPGEALDKTGQVVEKAGRAMAEVAAAFRRGTITTEFISYATSITNHQHFQFATLKQMELFTRSEESTTGFGYVPLPEVIVEARAPVEFTYYLDLNAKWDFLLKDDVIYVLAPPIRFNKPAVDASALTYQVKKGFLNTDEAQENLKKSITSLVTLRARENVPLVIEAGRRQTAEFAERWLVRSFSDGKRYPVKVLFPGEKLPDGALVEPKPLPK